MSSKIVASFYDHNAKRVFIRYEGGVIAIWSGDPVHASEPDPEGIVWAALTGQRSGDVKINMESPPMPRPSFANLSDYDEPLPLANHRGCVARINRIRDAARKLSIDQGGVRDNPDVAALLVEIFAP